MPIPNDTLWVYPGFPSIFVTYESSTDFYFSGHTSFAVIASMNLDKKGYKLFGILNIILQIFTIIVTKSHYYPDILTGFIVPYYIKSIITS
jgi:hypothetical protein